MDSDFITVLLVFILGFVAGWHLRALTILRNLVNNPQEMIKVLTELKEISAQEERYGGPVSTDTIELEIEHHQDVIYAYDKLTGEFIAQGSTEQELLDSARKRFPNKDFWKNNSK